MARPEAARATTAHKAFNDEVAAEVVALTAGKR